MPGSLIFALALAYLLLLFAVASYGDRKARRSGHRHRPAFQRKPSTSCMSNSPPVLPTRKCAARRLPSA